MRVVPDAKNDWRSWYQYFFLVFMQGVRGKLGVTMYKKKPGQSQQMHVRIIFDTPHLTEKLYQDLKTMPVSFAWNYFDGCVVGIRGIDFNWEMSSNGLEDSLDNGRSTPTFIREFHSRLQAEGIPVESIQAHSWG